MEELSSREVDLGCITLGEKVICTDPCYSIGTWCTTMINNMKPGKYKTVVVMGDFGEWGHRAKELYVLPEDVSVESFISSGDYGYIGSGGVDSGTFGFIDHEHLQSLYDAHTDKDKAVDEIMDIFSVHSGDEEMPYFVSKSDKGMCVSSGFGDGSYPIYGTVEDNKVTGLCVIFIGDEEDED